MKNAVIIALSLGVAAVLAVLFFRLTGPAQKPRIVTIGGAVISVEIADTEAKREKGLSGRTSLTPGQGMLFVFNKSDQYYFWMKDMRFPLDFVYLNNNEVVEIKENVSQFDTTPFAPSVPVDAVLEVNAGFVQSHNIRVGDLASY